MLRTHLHPPHPLFTDEALSLAAVAAGHPFVKQANPTPAVIVLLTTAPNGDTAPPTPGGTSFNPHPVHI